jgi:hypothetical protein
MLIKLGKGESTTSFRYFPSSSGMVEANWQNKYTIFVIAIDMERMEKIANSILSSHYKSKTKNGKNCLPRLTALQIVKVAIIYQE